MATYNELYTSLACPRCGAIVETIVNCYFGWTGQIMQLKIGDSYPWVAGAQPQNGGRPIDGTLNGEGFMECPRCHKPAWFFVVVRSDLIVGVELDAKKSRDMATYNELHTAATCPLCCADVEGIIRCYFGSTSEMLDLKIGDRYPWTPHVPPQDGGRPVNGTLDGEGRMHCPHCHRFSGFRVLVRHDIIIGVEADSKKPEQIQD